MFKPQELSPSVSK